MSDTAYESALAQFLGRYEGYSAAIPDEMRASDYARLDLLGHTYLDYTGGGLYAQPERISFRCQQTCQTPA
ncbi:MAG: hypothetical protein Q7V14_04215 [Coriobacteriia bacterium]|nr:hypothetical protein [Coriobacteriia bacterium]MDO9107524.1 hypothetical protein [Coriobacteriia bacterium]